MTNAKGKETKQEQELKSCPVEAALAPVRQLKKGEQVSALIFEGGGTKGAASKVAAFWSAAMDEDAIELAGTKPLAPMLAACDAAATDKTAALASLHAQVRRCTPQAIPHG